MDGDTAKPFTGGIDFQQARTSFKKFGDDLVFTKVDKAANCVGIMCKHCYARLATAELEGPGYDKIEGELEGIHETS